MTLSAPITNDEQVTVTVLNAFNQWANIAGLRYQGVPLALNEYASPSAYAPYIGAAATEQFGLPYRTIYVNLSFAR